MMTQPLPTETNTCQGTAFNALLQAQLAELETLINTQQLPLAMEKLQAWQAESPEEGVYAYKLGQLILTHSTEHAKAKALFELATQADPNNPQYWVALAQACIALQEDATAFEHLKKALTVDETHQPAYALLAPLLHSHGFTEAAISTYEQWLSTAPFTPTVLEAYLALARLYQSVGMTDEALQTLEKAIAVDAENPLLFFLKGAALQAKGTHYLPEAQTAYEQALAFGGNQPELHEAMAQFYTAQQAYLKAIQHWVAVLELTPENANALQALATLLQQVGRTTQSIAVLNKLLALNPHHAQTHLALAHAFSTQGLVEEALMYYNQALDLSHDVGIELRKLLTVPVVHPSEASVKATHHKTLMGLKALSTTPFKLQNPLTQVGDTPFYLLQQGEPIKSLLEQYHTLLQQALPPVPSVPTAVLKPKSAQVTRIGIVSRSFQAESKLAWAIQGLLAHPQPNVEIVWFSVGQPLQWVAGVTPPTEGMETIQLSTTDWYECQQAILQQNVDCLLYTDINQDPVSTFLANLRLAPKQGAISLTGTTTGCKTTIDFIVTPPLVTETATSAFSEATVLPIETGLTVALKRIGENTKLLKQDFGVRYDDIVWLLPQAPYRIGIEQDALLLQALEAVPTAKLLVLASTEPIWQEQLKHRWQQQFPETIMERIIFLGHLREADLLQLFNVTDIVLDSLPSSEPLTSLQALNFGTPLLTLQTSTSASLLQAFSPSHCVQLVQPNSTEWVKQLITLSQQPEALLALKTALRTEVLAYFSPQRHTHVKTAFWQTLLNAVQPAFV